MPMEAWWSQWRLTRKNSFAGSSCIFCPSDSAKSGITASLPFGTRDAVWLCAESLPILLIRSLPQQLWSVCKKSWAGNSTFAPAVVRVSFQEIRLLLMHILHKLLKKPLFWGGGTYAFFSYHTLCLDHLYLMTVSLFIVPWQEIKLTNPIVSVLWYRGFVQSDYPTFIIRNFR